LPDGSCDENTDIFKMCTYNAVLAWAIGGNRVSLISYIKCNVEFFSFLDGSSTLLIDSYINRRNNINEFLK
jgi:hypothetical protein